MACLAHSSESTHLLVNTVRTDSSTPLQQERAICVCPPLKHLCLPSKATILILLWTAVVGTMYYTVLGIAAAFTVVVPSSSIRLSASHSIAYAILALVMIFYPLSGFIADVCCGRLKTVVVSLILLLACAILVVLGLSVGKTLPHHSFHDLGHNQGIFVVILALISMIAMVIGLAGYQANFIQLGLDQLFEAPSQYLGLFIHYAVWAFHSGSVLPQTIFSVLVCPYLRKPMTVVSLTIPFMIIIILTILLLVTCWKRRWFYSEPGRNNPYKIVYNIINFARRHKHPLRRSAFTHSDNYIPSRLDFAKERFGGPFTTEQVENVKTFFRILLVLSAVGLVFALEVPASIFFFPHFGLHILNHNERESCKDEFFWKLMIGSGSGMAVVSTVILFPTYIWITFHLLRKKVLKLFVRLGVGIVICLMGVMSLLITDVVGHSMYGTNATNHTLCMFYVTRKHLLSHPTLNIHWAVLVPPNLLLGVGPLIVIATTFEFISAQSPQPMKGLLVGVFFAIRGLFQFLDSIVIIPLSLRQPWASGKMIEHPPVTNCGFVYLLFTCVIGLIGLILFSVTAKRYKYRTRDEGMFRQQDVEEIYDRYITQAAVDSFSE